MGFFGGKKKQSKVRRGGRRNVSKPTSESAGLTQAQKEKKQVLDLGEIFKRGEIGFSELVLRLGAFYEYAGGTLNDESPLMDQGFDELAVAETVISLQEIFGLDFEVADESLYVLSVKELKVIFKV